MDNDKIILDIENFLEIMEPICLKYRGTYLADNLIFVRGKRLPLEHRWESGNYPSDFVSNSPFHPIVAAGLARDIILYMSVDDKYKALMVRNPMLEKCIECKQYAPQARGLEHLISSYFADKIEDEDVAELATIARKLMKYVSKFRIPNDKVLDIDIEEKWFVITVGDNIAFLRMKEAGFVRR